jgi:hypothetical protein
MDRRSGSQAHHSPQAGRDKFASLEGSVGWEKRIAHIEHLIYDSHQKRQGNFIAFPYGETSGQSDPAHSHPSLEGRLRGA